MNYSGEGRFLRGGKLAKIFVRTRPSSGGVFASGEVVPIRKLDSGAWERDTRSKTVVFYTTAENDRIIESKIEDELRHHLKEFTLAKTRRNPAIDPDLLKQERTSEMLMRAYEQGARNFRNADLKGAYLAGIDLSGSNLEGADLSQANLEGADLINVNLSGANLTGANLRNASMVKSNLENASFAGADLQGAYLSDTNLVGASLVKANAQNANFADATFDKTDFREADLKGAYLETPYIGTVDFRGAKVDGRWPMAFGAMLEHPAQTNPGPASHQKRGLKLMMEARKCWDRYCKSMDVDDALGCFEMLAVAHQELSYVKDKKNLKEVKQGLREVKKELEDQLKGYRKNPELSDVGASMAAQLEQAIERNPLNRGQKNPLSAADIKKIRRARLSQAMKGAGISRGAAKAARGVRKRSVRKRLNKAAKRNPDDIDNIVEEAKEAVRLALDPKTRDNVLNKEEEILRDLMAAYPEATPAEFRKARKIVLDAKLPSERGPRPIAGEIRSKKNPKKSFKKLSKAQGNPAQKPTRAEMSRYRSKMPSNMQLTFEHGLFTVRYRDGQPGISYHSDDPQDAIETAKAWAKHDAKQKKNPNKKKKKAFASKAKEGAARVGEKAKRIAKTDTGRAGIGAGAGALLLGPVGAVAGAAGALAAKKNPGSKSGAFMSAVKKQISRMEDERLLRERSDLESRIRESDLPKASDWHEIASGTMGMYDAEIKKRGLKKNPAPPGKLTQSQAVSFAKKEGLRLGKLPKKYYPMWVETYESAKAYYGDSQTGSRVAWSQVKKYCEKVGDKWMCGPLPKPKKKSTKKK